MNHNKWKTRNKGNRGVALVTALLLLSLFTVMTLSMVIATTSDTLIDGYYRNARGSFYGADSGINAARQYIVNQFAAAIPSPYTAFSTTVPISAGTETTTLTNLNNSTSGFGAYQSSLGSQSSWVGNFKVDSANTSLGTPTCQIFYTNSTGTVPTCTSAGNGSATYYQYSYPYKITVIGQSSASETNTIEEQGTIFVTATINATTSTASSFAAWGMFIDQSTICDGSSLVGGTITGPVFTNGSWNLGTTSTGYIFTGSVGSVGTKIGYQYSGTCNQSTSYPNSSGGVTISPTFRSGIGLGQHSIPLPTNSYDQKQAVLDGIGTADGTLPTQSQMAVLKNAGGTSWPSTGTQPTTGVYLPYWNNGGTLTFGTAPSPSTAPAGCGGGIYVEGDATVTVSAGTVTSTSSPQIYTIVQGSTTTTVTIDTLANHGIGQTRIVSGSSNQTITGVPQQCTSPGAVTRDATMLYVDGNITALKGSAEGVGSIQDTTALDVVANGAITITGDLKYVSEPVTLTQSGSTPADTLIPANNHNQAFGIYTANGNVNLANAQSDQNLEIDASIATISASGSGGIVNTGTAIKTLTIVGGRIQNTIQNINTTTRNVWFDARYAQGGFSPPWFPSTTISTTTTYVNPVPVVSVNRTSWVNTSAQ